MIKKINGRAVDLAIGCQFSEKGEEEKAFDRLCSAVLIFSGLYFAQGIARWYFSI